MNAVKASTISTTKPNNKRILYPSKPGMKNPEPRSMAPDGRAYIPRSLADDDDDARCFEDVFKSSSLIFFDALHNVTIERLSNRRALDCIRRDGGFRVKGERLLARAAAGDDDDSDDVKNVEENATVELLLAEHTATATKTCRLGRVIVTMLLLLLRKLECDDDHRYRWEEEACDERQHSN